VEERIVYSDLSKNLSTLLYSKSFLRISWDRYSLFGGFIYVRRSNLVIIEVIVLFIVDLSTRDSLVTQLEAPMVVAFLLRVVEVDQS